jgi:hypothetical protein
MFFRAKASMDLMTDIEANSSFSLVSSGFDALGPS